MGEALLRAGASVVGLDAQVASVGSWENGVPADPNAVAVMAARGLDIGAHRSRVMRPIDIEAAHLVLGMASEHVIEVATLVPDAFAKTFTLKEFTERARSLGPKDPSLDLEIYLRLLNEPRNRQDLLRVDAGWDIADPLGQGRRSFERAATEIEGLVWASVDLLVGYPPRT